MSYLGKSNLTSKHNHFQFTAVPQKRLSSYTEERVDLSLSGEPILILRSLAFLDPGVVGRSSGLAPV